jgi:hypothetical protein
VKYVGKFFTVRLVVALERNSSTVVDDDSAKIDMETAPPTCNNNECSVDTSGELSHAFHPIAAAHHIDSLMLYITSFAATLQCYLMNYDNLINILRRGSHT